MANGLLEFPAFLLEGERKCNECDKSAISMYSVNKNIEIYGEEYPATYWLPLCKDHREVLTVVK